MPDDLPVPVRTLEALPAIRDAIGELDAQRKTLAEAGEVELLGHGAADLATLIADLNLLLRAVKSDVAKLLIAAHQGRGLPKMDLPGVGRIDVPGGSEWRGWDSERLLRHLVFGALPYWAEFAIDPETGEVLSPSPSEVAESIVQTLLDCLPITASTGWKRGSKDPATGEMTGLRGYGIRLEDFAEKVDKPRLARLPKREN